MKAKTRACLTVRPMLSLRQQIRGDEGRVRGGIRYDQHLQGKGCTRISKTAAVEPAAPQAHSAVKHSYL